MENNPDSFPRELLNKPISERKMYFKDKLISHPKLEEAYKNAKRKLSEGTFQLMFLYGPSGVGKSTLLKKLRYDIISQMLLELEQDKGRIPVIYFEAKSPESVKFSWNDFFAGGLMALHEPCLDKKIIPKNLVMPEIIKTNDTSSALRWNYESALINRRPVVCIVDEAQHIAKTARGSKIKDQMDVIKNISNMTAIPHLLSGTYELLKFRNKSAQLSNRSNDIHLERYRAEIPTDIRQFKTTILSLQDHLPVHEVDLLEHWAFLYERSIGCIGVLKLWLERALNACLEESGKIKVLTHKHLVKTALTIEQCNTMVTEAREGELTLIETEEDRLKLITTLGLHLVPKDSKPDAKPSKAKETTQTKETTKPKKNSKVGERKPTRDAVGTNLAKV